MNKTKAYNVLVELKDIMEELDIEFWLDGGTCLGAYRENDFMDSDFDIDIGIMYSDKLPKIIDNLNDNGFEHIHHKQHPSGIGNQISAVKYDIPMDIFVYHESSEHVFRIMFDIVPGVNTVKYIPIVFHKYVFHRLEVVDFMYGGVLFNLPAHTDKYLAFMYGNWQVDKKPGVFKWQTDYLNMVPDFKFWDKPETKTFFISTHDIHPTQYAMDYEFFLDSIKQGYKLYPIIIDRNNGIVDGNKRWYAYDKLGVPLVEVYRA